MLVKEIWRLAKIGASKLKRFLISNWSKGLLIAPNVIPNGWLKLLICMIVFIQAHIRVTAPNPNTDSIMFLVMLPLSEGLVGVGLGIG